MPHNLKNIRGQLVGSTKEINGKEYAYDRQGKLLGWYDRATDHTHDSAGRLITTSGDATSNLIFGEGDEK
ncbi:MAG: hypothetical protein ACREP6_12420 [Candidatus Binataceae bacterium]